MSTGTRFNALSLPRIALVGPLVGPLIALVVACGGTNEGKPVGSAEKPLPGKSIAFDDGAPPAGGGDVALDGGDAKADGAAAADAAAAEGAAAEGAAAAAAEGAAAEGAAAAAAEGAAAEGADAEADDGGTPAVDPAALRKEIANAKTTDARALEALAELETTGAKLRDVAKAANTRGEKLFATPDRAKIFFEWAADKDKKFPEPVFNLAKQSANGGDVDATRELLTQVKARGGKKLLTQVDFDPMWEIVKDDPEVRKLLEG